MKHQKRIKSHMRKVGSRKVRVRGHLRVVRTDIKRKGKGR